MNAPFKIVQLPAWADTPEARDLLTALAGSDIKLTRQGDWDGTIYRYRADTLWSEEARALRRLRWAADIYSDALFDRDMDAWTAHRRSGHGYYTPADALLAKVRGEYVPFDEPMMVVTADASEVSPVEFMSAVQSTFGMGRANQGDQA